MVGSDLEDGNVVVNLGPEKNNKNLISVLITLLRIFCLTKIETKHIQMIQLHMYTIGINKIRNIF